MRALLFPVLLIVLLLACDEPRAATTDALPASESPFAGTLVFQSDRNGSWDLFLIEADGTGLRPLTAHPAHDKQPAFSPQGDRIAFSSERTGAGDIYVMNADGSGKRRLTDHPACEGAPSWSLDGKWIAFEGQRDGRSEIYRVEADSGRVERLTESRSRKLDPAYSHHGFTLAYMEKGPIRWHVSLLDRRSGATRRASRGGGACHPDWAPNGRLLAYVSTRESNKADIRLMDVTRGTSWQLVTRPNAHNYDPAFSPDGLALAFASTVDRRSEQWDLYVADINGRNLIQLTSGAASDRFPDWRPIPRTN